MVPVNRSQASAASESYPTFQRKNLKRKVLYDNHAFFLDDEGKCKEKFGFSVGTILAKPAHNPAVVLGIGKKDGALWVANPLHIKEVYPIKDIQNQSDLKKRGYTWIASESNEMEKTKKQKLIINDSEDCVRRIHRIFEQEIGCDIFFQFGEVKIGAHSLLLKESTLFFEKLLGGNFKEGIQKNPGQPNIIPIGDCDPDDFRLILNYLYSGSIEINPENILLIAKLADQFFIEKLKEHCQNQISFFLTTDLALTYFQMIFQHTEDFFLLPIIEDYIFKHLTEIIKTEKETILNLSQEAFLYLINKSSTEDRVQFFAIAMIWLQHPEEMQRLEFLVKHILPLLPKNFNNLIQYAQILSPLINSFELSLQFKEKFSTIADHKWMLFIYGVAVSHACQSQESEKTLKPLLLAEEALKQFLLFEPQHIFALAIYAKVQTQLGQWDLAKEKFEEILEKIPPPIALKEMPFFIFMRNHYAQTLLRLRQLYKAKAQFEKVLRIASNNLFALKGYAETLRQYGKLDLAKAKFEEALEIAPKDVFALSRYAETLRQLDLLVLAKAKFEEALKIIPNSVFALSGYADTLRQLGQWDLAKAKFEEVLKIAPNDAFALAHYAETLRQLDLLVLAKANFEEALKAVPKTLFVLLHYAETLCMLGQWSLAKANFEEVLKIAPNNISALIHYAETLCQLGQWDLAKAKLERALKIAPKDVFVLSSYAETLRQCGQLDLARAKFEEALQMAPNYAFVLTNYAETLRQLGQLDLAKAKFEETLQIVPNE